MVYIVTSKGRVDGILSEDGRTFTPTAEGYAILKERYVMYPDEPSPLSVHEDERYVEWVEVELSDPFYGNPEYPLVHSIT